MTKNQFNPDYAVHPGQLLSEILESRGISRYSFSRKSEITCRTLDDFINGKVSIDSASAEKIGGLLGVHKSIWINMQKNYDDFVDKNTT